MNSCLNVDVCERNKCRIPSIIVIENNITGNGVQLEKNESSSRVTKFVQVSPPIEYSDNY